METPRSTQSQDGNGSWHPAIRPNGHEPDRAYDSEFGQNSLEPEASTEKINGGELLPQPSLQFENVHFEQPEQPVQLLKDGHNLPGASPTDGVGLPRSGDYERSTVQISGTELENEADIGKVSQNKGSKGELAELAASGLVPAESHPNLREDIHGAERVYRSEAVKIPENLTEPQPNPFEDALGGKEGMEKAWESEKNITASGPLSRTNSFPEIPPLQAMPIDPPCSLPHSQAEDIMGVKYGRESLQHGAFHDNLCTDNAGAKSSQHPFDSLETQEDESFLSKTQGVPPFVSTAEAEEESRYEEGLPLMPSSADRQPPASPLQRTHDAEVATFPGANEDEYFFDKASPARLEDSSSFAPPPLDRKSTTQVLDSMHYLPHSINYAESEVTEERPSLADLTGGGIAVSTSTVESQVFTQQRTNAAVSGPKDEDLADMWKAALGDDDLLEEDEPSVDPSSFFEDDGEGFLEVDQDEQENKILESAASSPLQPVYAPDGSMQGFSNSNTKQLSTVNKYQPPSTFQPQQMTPPTLYAAQTGHTSVHQQPRATSGLNQPSYSPNGLPNGVGQRPSTAQPLLSRPQISASTQSFADKSKGGYTSPYDLPMDVTRPKKRTSYQQTRPSPDAQTAASRPPPPRSSSMFASAAPPMGSPPPVPGLPSAQRNPQTGNTLPPQLKSLPSSGSFFEELPSKPRQPNIVNRNVPPVSRPRPPPPTSSQGDAPRQSSLPEQSAPGSAGMSQQYQLVPPERMSLYGSPSPTEHSTRSLPAINARYSPAPTKTSSVPPPPHRYATSPLTGSRPSSQALPFQPRTSSPLAQHHALQLQNQQNLDSEQAFPRPHLSSREVEPLEESTSAGSPFPNHQSPEKMPRNTYQAEHERNWRAPQLSQLKESPPSLNTSHDGPLGKTPSDSSNATNTRELDHLSSDGISSLQQPYEAHMDASEVSKRGVPQRSQTQSPGAGKYRPELPMNMQNPYQRPASVSEQMSSLSVDTAPPSLNPTRLRGRTLSKPVSYVRPTDGRELDHLERWKGCPIISFGFGGVIVTSFPKQVPRYAAGQTAPMMKCSPGDVKLQDAKILPLDEDIATFPGPLKSKSKKKEVTEWLQRRIQKLEIEENRPSSGGALPDRRKCHEEKVLLWKIVRVLVEHDGVVDGSPSAEKAVRSILSPELSQGDDAAVPLQSSNTPLLGIRRRGSRNIPDPGSPEVVEELRKKLLRGEREKAVWHAVDNRLWAHALLISSTLDRGIWKQVSQEFVRQEVKTLGENTESLAALYQIFAGNWDESMDELVPPSARAGLQMVSKTATTGPTKNALDGLDRWQETLTLILSNRSSDEGNALVSLGQLLAGYGRTEAAHICYIFAKTPGLFGGPDDPQVSVTLLGADHLQHPLDYSRDFDNILLTEVYEFARTVLASSSAATVAPHLQSYKLYHAMILAEYGYKTEAQQYCEIITSALKSTTKPSPYYHNLLFGTLDNFMDRLRQAPKDSSGSWISKPSIDKMSGSIWAKFNQYVAGDESDAGSTGSGKAPEQDVGPFGRVSGDSPTLSREPSSGDLYSSHHMGIGSSPSAPVISASNSRYGPASFHTPRSSLEQTSRSSQEHQRSSQADLLRPSFAHQQYQSRPASSTGSYHELYKPVTQTSSYPPRSGSYLPTPLSQPDYMPDAPPDELPSHLHQQRSHQPTPPLEPQLSHEEDQQIDRAQTVSSSEPPSSYYDPSSSTNGPLPASGYEPPSLNGYDRRSSDHNASPSIYEPPPGGTYEPSNGYDPQSYNPDVPQVAASPVEENYKKKSFMDDDEDDDFEARAAALRKAEKARKDREADEAFKRAAEADAQKDKAPELNAKKSGWLAGWFSGKKDGDAAQGTPNAPIKAKLGEQSSFYYDPEKKRWIDKKNPDATPAATAAPPPPKGPPSRAVSGAVPPRPSSTSTPPVPPLPIATSTPPITLSKPPTSNGAFSSTSNPLSGTPSPAVLAPDVEESAAEGLQTAMRSVSGPPSGPPSAPPSRPSTSMSGASSIDDLIGAPQARKGGTVRKGKKGRGYVDVMAK